MQKKSLPANEENCCEIIELAIDDIELLTRTFNLIGEVCAEGMESLVDEIAPEKNAEKIVLQ